MAGKKGTSRKRSVSDLSPAAQPNAKVAKTNRQSTAVSKRKAVKEKENFDGDALCRDDNCTNDDEFSKSAPKIKVLDTNRPPIVSIDDIFREITSKAIALGFEKKVLQHLLGQPLRIATMCSGTESPILALRMVRDELKNRGYAFPFDHIFSAEIEPYKQAYIERNFRTSIIFRDVREIATGKQASTAYGADVDVPRGIDLLVAGFACVDFSNLNSKPKGLSGNAKLPKARSNIKPKTRKQKPSDHRVVMSKKNKSKKTRQSTTNASAQDRKVAANLKSMESTMRGESGDTLFSLLLYASNHRPSLVLLENVCSAPWREICKKWNAIGYEVTHYRLDTKNYYIPHTRQRVYMFGINRTSMTSGEAKAAVARWVEFMDRFRRPASSSADAFLLDEADPRLFAATMELTRGAFHEKATKETSWSTCQARHWQLRRDKQLGDARPITQWMENGSSIMLDYGNGDWTKKQVNRVKDTLDLTWLLAAAVKDFDPAFKARYLDLSQNVDRHPLTGTWGITGCVTPAGIPYSTTRGGPIVGYEALALQGIPIDKLHFTKESQKDLQDLAGNAMTSTVVGAAILSALLAASKAIPKREFCQENDVTTDTRRSLEYQPVTNPYMPIEFGDSVEISTSQLSRCARRSAQLCSCEGQNHMVTRKIYKCRKCFYTACEKCAGIPRHYYEPLDDKLDSRVAPEEFRQSVKQAFPMRLRLTHQIRSLLQAPETMSEELVAHWASLLEVVQLALRDDYRFCTIKRSNFWTICYDGDHSRLELEAGSKSPAWFLYAKPMQSLAANAEVRKMLESPIARMKPAAEDVLEGPWEFRIPKHRTFDVSVHGQGPMVPSRNSRLGLDKFREQKVWSKLNVEVTLGDDKDINGIYELLPDCGTAGGHLHRRVTKDSDLGYFLFLDPHRVGEPIFDQFVFADTHHRLRYGQYRHIDACMGKSYLDGNENWRPTDFAGPQNVKCNTYGKWEKLEGALVPVEDQLALFSAISDETFVFDVAATGCSVTNFVALACKVPLRDGKLLSWPRVACLAVDEYNERQVFTGFSWLTERIKSLQGFSKGWREVAFDETISRCDSCAPQKPAIKWKRGGHKLATIVPYEDPAEAGPYERKIKSQPSPITTCLTHNDILGEGELRICFNVVALLHRAFAKMEELDGRSNSRLQLSWMLDTSCDFTRDAKLPHFQLPNNQAKMPRPFQFAYSKSNAALRSDQQRTLSWMLERESPETPPFAVDVIEEACIRHFGWRLLARTRKMCDARGGVLADQVGFGKTIVILALIAVQRQQAEAHAVANISGHIPLKATLIICPALLLPQWMSEIVKFLGKHHKIIVIRTIGDLEKKTVADFQDADVILASHTFFQNEKYLLRMSRFAARPDPPTTTGGRALDIWLREAIKPTVDHLKELQKSQKLKKFRRVLNKRLFEAETDEALLERLPSKRLKGKAYIKQKGITKKEEPASQVAELKTDDPFSLDKAKDWTQLRGPLFWMFYVKRIVLDEYTYQSPQELAVITAIPARYRWVLSGTPALDGFPDVKALAALVRIPLGLDDDMRGVGNKRLMKAIQQDRTKAERFASLVQSQSTQWHEDRHNLAQSFLSTFVSQNVAEIGYIAVETYYHSSKLHLAEYAAYSELQIQLYGQNMQMVVGNGSTAETDHASRLNELIISSSSPEEALLKSSTNMETKNGNSSRRSGKIDVCQVMIERRLSVLYAQAENLRGAIKAAAGLKRYCGTADTYYTGWIRSVKKGTHGDHEVTKELSAMISSAEEQASAEYSSQTWQLHFKLPKPQKCKASDFVEEESSTDDEKSAEEGTSADDRMFVEKETSTVEGDSTEGENSADEEDSAEPSSRSRRAKVNLVRAQNHEKYPLSNMTKVKRDPVAKADPVAKEGPVAKKDPVAKLRADTNRLIESVTKYIGMKRRARFVIRLEEIHRWTGQRLPLSAFQTDCCGGKVKHVEDLYLLALCGHTLCQKCRTSPNRGITCSYKSCTGGALDFHTIKATDLKDRRKTVRGPVHHGTKIERLVDLVEQISKKGDQALLFVQFPDVMNTIERAFISTGVSFAKINGENQSYTKDDREMRSFKGGLRGSAPASVLILKAGNSCAAGHNLTNANHVIFISPFHANSQHKYQQMYEQAIGRACRFGQLKIVEVHHFMALNTFDINLIEDCTGKKVVERQTTKKFELVDRSELTDSEKVQDYTTIRYNEFRTRAFSDNEDD